MLAQPRPKDGYVLESLVLPVTIAMILSFVLYPTIAQGISALLDPIALQVIKGDVSQYMQNFFNFNSLLFSFFASRTYSVLYQQQESLYVALYAEVAQVRSLLEQMTLVLQGRPNYKATLSNLRDYTTEMVLGVRFGCPPAVLVGRKPVNDPLEGILYFTSVGVPSALYDTVRGLREARGARLGASQRKLPQEHFVLLYALGALELLVFPLLGAGISTYEPMDQVSLPGHILSLQAFIFAFLVGGVLLTLRVVEDLRSPTSGLYSLDAVLDEMVGGLREELDRRVNSAPRTADSDESRPSVMSSYSDAALAQEYLTQSYSGVQDTKNDAWSSLEPSADRSRFLQKAMLIGGVGLGAALCFPVLASLLQVNLSEPTLLAIRGQQRAVAAESVHRHRLHLLHLRDPDLRFPVWAAGSDLPSPVHRGVGSESAARAGDVGMPAARGVLPGHAAWHQ